jgi:hypothetical protein
MHLYVCFCDLCGSGFCGCLESASFKLAHLLVFGPMGLELSMEQSSDVC